MLIYIAYREGTYSIPFYALEGGCLFDSILCMLFEGKGCTTLPVYSVTGVPALEGGCVIALLIIIYMSLLFLVFVFGGWYILPFSCLPYDFVKGWMADPLYSNMPCQFTKGCLR